MTPRNRKHSHLDTSACPSRGFEAERLCDVELAFVDRKAATNQSHAAGTPQCTAAYRILSCVASAASNSATMRPVRATRMRSETARISGR